MTAKDFLKKEGILRDSEIIDWMERYAEIKAVEFQKWVQENATYSRRLTEQGYRLKSTPFSAYELLSTEQLYDKFKEASHEQ